MEFQLPCCSVCLEPFSCSLLYRLPRSLPCGHSFCGSCLSDLVKISALISCPQCRKVHVPNPEYGLDTFPRNYAFIEYMNENMDACTDSASQQPGSPSPRGLLTDGNVNTQEEGRNEVQGAKAKKGEDENEFIEDISMSLVVNMRTTVQQLMAAFKNSFLPGEVLDLKGMVVDGDGPLYIDVPITLKNASILVEVVITAPSVALHNVNVRLGNDNSGVREGVSKGELVHIQSNNCHLFNCKLEAVGLLRTHFIGVSLSRGSASIMATTIQNCHVGVRVSGSPIEIRRCNLNVEQIALCGRAASVVIESCNLQGKCCLNISQGCSSLMRECSLVASGDSTVHVQGPITNLHMERCRMQSAKEAAVKVEMQASLKMEHCEIGGNPEDAHKMMAYGNQRVNELVCSAVMGRMGANIHLINCSICKVPYGVVGINEETNIKLECCNIVTTLSHLFIERGAYVVASHSNFMDALGSGAVFAAYQGSRVEMERCKIHQAYWHLLHAIQGAKIQATQCDIWGTQQNAISAWNHPTQVIVQQSRLGGSGKAVVVPYKGARIHLKQSDVWGLEQPGLIADLITEGCTLR
eukprot:TRINITY_DN14676_c0_g1_i13.p1 TRINITY_DN14676_c0_g1~~TRINITY_DN14676_c0_g1_i13.p1  ORF type:complete len:580 (-),score=48.68 TRINITY_DN14676_c0_g1_i13:1254-2993(-)